MDESHLVDDAADVVEHLLLGAVTVDLLELVLVLADDRLDVRVVHLEAVLRLLLGVVAALGEAVDDVLRRGRT